MSQTITATVENGALMLSEPLRFPPHSQVRVTIELLEEPANDSQKVSMAPIYEVLSRRYASGHTDTAERHNEHQP